MNTADYSSIQEANDPALRVARDAVALRAMPGHNPNARCLNCFYCRYIGKDYGMCFLPGMFRLAVRMMDTCRSFRFDGWSIPTRGGKMKRRICDPHPTSL